MTDTTLPTEPRRARRPARSRRPLNLRRRRRNHAVRRPPLAASEALTRLAVRGDIYKIGGLHYLVAPIDVDLLDTVIAALGAVEDIEPETDLGADDHGEPSLFTDGDLELDTADFEPSLGYSPAGGIYGSPVEDAEGPDSDAEPELGWANTGPQYRLHTGEEGDGDCDREDDDPGGDALDEGEDDPCDQGEEDRCDDERDGAAQIWGGAA